jgi:hypothetical protein
MMKILTRKMTLAAILAVCFLSVQNAGYSTTGWLPPAGHGPVAQSPDKQPPAAVPSTASTPEGQSSSSSQAAPVEPPSTSTPDSANQPKPGPKPHHRRKKATPNCSTADPGASSAEKPASSTPCPPPKKVVRKGGSNEPPVQFTGGTSAEQALHTTSTNQLSASTQDNLKKIAGRPLNPSQQEMVSQVKQFMEQSKTALAAGDHDRAHNLAVKANLLSVELVKP